MYKLEYKEYKSVKCLVIFSITIKSTNAKYNFDEVFTNFS